MPRRTTRPKPTREIELTVATRVCPGCDRPLWAAYKSHRTVATPEGLVRFAVQVRRCRDDQCPRHNISLRAEREGAIALPQHEFGLDVIALIGRLRHVEHRSIPEIQTAPTRRGVAICVRSVGSLLDRHDERLALAMTDPSRLRRIIAQAGRVILAIDGLQPNVGHGVLRVIRDVLSGEVLLARSLLSSCQDDLAGPLSEVKQALRAEGDDPEVPIVGVVSDGQHSIRNAVAEALPGVPHQVCQSHHLREAARPVYEADRHAKVRLKKEARGIRPIERQVEGRDDAEAEVVRGYCAAVRSAPTGDGRPPLEASGLRLRDRLAEIAASLDRAGFGVKRGSRGNRRGCGRSWARPWRRRSRSGPRCDGPSAGCIGRRRSSATRKVRTPPGSSVASGGSWVQSPDIVDPSARCMGRSATSRR